jgi:hypothetical protein
MSTPDEDRPTAAARQRTCANESGTVVSVRDRVMDTPFDVIASFEALIGPQQARRLRIRESPSR